MAPKKQKKNEPFAYEVSRYQPRIKAILQDSIAGVLDSSAFSAVKGGTAASSSQTATMSASTSIAPVSLRHKTGASAATASSMTANSSASTVPSRSVIMFIIGGVTFSEIRAAYEVAEQSKREVYIGKPVTVDDDAGNDVNSFHFLSSRIYAGHHSQFIP